MIDLSIILVSYNTLSLTRECLLTLKKSSFDKSRYEVFIIDNASKDASAEMIDFEFPDVHLVKNETNVGFGRANNQVLDKISGRYVLLLNTDAFVEPDTIEKTVSFMDQHPETGILGVKLVGRDGVLQPSCRYFPTPWNLFLNRTGFKKYFKRTQMVDDMAWDHNQVRRCDWVPGCYYLIRREVVEKVGLFDPRFFLYYEEVDHCYATKKSGWEVIYYPETTVIHIGGESAKTDNKISKSSKQVSKLQIESELLYFRKNQSVFGFVSYLFLFVLADTFVYLKSLINRLANRMRDNHLLVTPLFIRLLIKTRLGSKPLH